MLYNNLFTTVLLTPVHPTSEGEVQARWIEDLSSDREPALLLLPSILHAHARSLFGVTRRGGSDL